MFKRSLYVLGISIACNRAYC